MTTRPMPVAPVPPVPPVAPDRSATTSEWAAYRASCTSYNSRRIIYEKSYLRWQRDMEKWKAEGGVYDGPLPGPTPEPDADVVVSAPAPASQDIARLALAVNVANAAIATGVQAGDFRWHGGDTDFEWAGVRMDAPGLVEYAKSQL